MQSIGKAGEDQAVSFLEKRGYKVLARNHESIGIVAQAKRSTMDRFLGKPATTVFVEIRGKEVASVQRERIEGIALAYLSAKGLPSGSPWRIDVLSIINPQNSQNCQVEHFQNV